MDWKKERDELIAQTLAFVQSVTGEKEAAGAPSAALWPAALGEVFSAPPPAPAPFPPAPPPAAAAPAETADVVEPDEDDLRKSVLPKFSTDFQTEIREHVANFRAHQERLIREREEFSNAALMRLRAAVAALREQMPRVDE
jgi:hypothetical protein